MMPNRCLYISSFKEFLVENPLAVLGALHNNYHGEALTTTDEAWKGEIDILQEDPTRLPEYYDGTFEYLKGLGIKELES